MTITISNKVYFYFTFYNFCKKNYNFQKFKNEWMDIKGIFMYHAKISARTSENVYIDKLKNSFPRFKVL